MSLSDTAPGRSCADCTLCCKVLGIPALGKTQGQECVHCDTGRGCKIYARRPDACRDFTCSYLLSPALGEEWAPNRSHMVLGYMSDADVVIIYTDPDHPDAWRRAPYLARVKTWANSNIGYVLVWESGRARALHGDNEFALGALRDDQIIVRDARPGPAGEIVTISVADRNAR